jgi:hypothetical protein
VADGKVFFATQLAVQNEDRFIHWITYRAIGDLIGKPVKTEMRQMKTGARIRLLWHRGHRYFRRDAATLVRLVGQYSDPSVCASLGLHGETMILGGFARKQFVLRGEHTREFGGRRWTETGHDPDFIFERDEVAYGVEVKNSLSYMEQDEFRIKIRLCKHLNVRPVFAVRMLPRPWIIELVSAGGYAMILKYQLYPWTHARLAKRVPGDFGLPRFLHLRPRVRTVMCLLNEFLKEHGTVQELKKEIAVLTATVKEQAAQIQNVSAQIEMSKPAPQVVNNP